MSANSPMQLDLLLAQAGWAKALARSLARDDDSADELVQRTWVAALTRPPRALEEAVGASGTPGTQGAPAALRSWIASVMRNFARQEAREQERRTERERRAARPESSGPMDPGGSGGTGGSGAGGAVEGLEVANAHGGIESQRRLLTALAALPDPYRAVLFARYFEGRMPREIARSTGAPVKTVKSQLGRGLALLRTRLDRDHGGDRGAWMAWVLPLASQSATRVALLGALIVDSKLKVGGALLALVCALAVGAGLWRADPLLPAPSPAPAEEPAPLQVPEEKNFEQEQPPSAERATVDAPAAAPFVHPPHAVADPVGPVRGRVLDLEDRPVGFVRIVLEGGDPFQARMLAKLPPPEVQSDAEGWFEIVVPSLGVRLLVDDARWATVYKAHVGGDVEREAAIYVAPRRLMAGTVVTPEGLPVEGAEVELRLDDSVKLSLDRRLDSSYRQNFLAKADAAGRFELERAPACAGKLHVNAPGWSAVTLAAPEQDATDLVIVLGAPPQRPALVAGVVVDESGKPLADAHVALGANTQTTAADGRFLFDLDSPMFAPGPPQETDEAAPGEASGRSEPRFPGPQAPRDLLRAVKYGRLPAEARVPPLEELRLDPAPREYRLVLQKGVLEIRGHVVEADGQGVAGASITVLNETPFGIILERVGEAAVGHDASLERMLRGGIYMGIADSSADGLFLVQGLTARKYDLAALDARTLRYAVVRGVEAGTRDARIEMPPAAGLVHVAGRVVSRAGEGVPGIDLHIGRLSEGARTPDMARSLTTDAEGRFDLGTVDPEFLRIQVMGEKIFLIMDWRPPPGARLDALEIVVSQRCPVKVELSPRAPRADEFSFLDAQGEPTQNLQFYGPMISLPERCALQDGVSEVYATEDAARTLVLYSKGQEVERLPVRLVPGEVTTLRP